MSPESLEELIRKVDRQGWLIRNLSDTCIHLAEELRDVKKDQEKDHEVFLKFMIAAKAATEAAEKAAVTNVTSKQLYISFAIAVCAIVGILAGVHPG